MAQGRGRHRNAVAGADVADAAGAGQHSGCRRGVVVAGAIPRIGEDAAVEHPGGQHRDPAGLAQGEQRPRRGVIEQRVPPGDQHAVEIAPRHEPFGERRGVDADADRPDRAVRAQPGQRGIGAVERLGEVIVGVVDERDVHPVQPQPPEAVLQRAQHPVRAVVAHPAQHGCPVELVGAVHRTRGGHEQPAHLGGDHELLPAVPGEEVADPLL
jgi:hypothetical protein